MAAPPRHVAPPRDVRGHAGLRRRIGIAATQNKPSHYLIAFIVVNIVFGAAYFAVYWINSH